MQCWLLMDLFYFAVLIIYFWSLRWSSNSQKFASPGRLYHRLLRSYCLDKFNKIWDLGKSYPRTQNLSWCWNICTVLLSFHKEIFFFFSTFSNYDYCFRQLCSCISYLLLNVKIDKIQNKRIVKWFQKSRKSWTEAVKQGKARLLVDSEGWCVTLESDCLSVL